MKVHYNFDNYQVQKSVITVGVFDGVHKGHTAILEKAKHSAQQVQGESVIVTFWPHPRLVLQQDVTIKLINTLDEKLAQFERLGIDHVVVIPFTEAFSHISSQEFVQDILVGKLNVKHLIVGFNHHFGKDREGNFDMMKEYANKHHFTLEKLDAQTIENEKVSSTLIRNALANGDIDTANKYLGYQYMISGKVVEGKRLGRTIGFPTANIQANADKLIPRIGVYAVEVLVANQRYPGMLNIGYNPTVDSSLATLHIEVHLLNFNEDIYNKDMTLLFKKRIRDEVKFNGLEQLKQQLEADKTEVLKILGA